ncbi:hypothetical protein BIV57_13515 [Mangrovactinospora gilvigrisea]|uniref:Uncharacterized protein n=1 Tax=Mangrovactinospora gilvigrisea TaxID=1428644 RepID=A0A1J7BU78_9ACTN|nr:hypothetical protein [Mangrovactinospora gilvigrisea]OIV37001.1 hypothetical protein BIV57_13515 [Mangrovactinospora gilvigrisea]
MFLAGVTLGPFLQALATRAATTTYDKARELLHRKTHPGPGGLRLRVEHADGEQAHFELPDHVPDAALRALLETDLEALGAAPKRDGQRDLERTVRTLGAACPPQLRSAARASAVRSRAVASRAGRRPLR